MKVVAALVVLKAVQEAVLLSSFLFVLSRFWFGVNVILLSSSVVWLAPAG